MVVVYFGGIGYFETRNLPSDAARRSTSDSLSCNRDDATDDVDLVWLQFPTVRPIFVRDEFKNLMKRSRLDIFWREHGWPDFCRPISDTDFECGMDESS